MELLTFVHACSTRTHTPPGADLLYNVNPGGAPHSNVSLLPSYTVVRTPLLSRYNLSVMDQLVVKGQDDARSWLPCRPSKPECATSQLALCPRGKATPEHV